MIIHGDCLDRLKELPKMGRPKYGIPFMGSKDSIVKHLVGALPAAENFYDLFGGGGAVSHYVAETQYHKWKNVFYNEINADIGELIQRAIKGEFNYSNFKPKWVSREEFQKNKPTCAYTRCLWSFGNNQRDYIFGKDKEGRKKSLHQAVVFGEFDELAKDLIGHDKWPEELSIKDRRLFCRCAIVKRKGELERLQQLEQLERLEQLEFSSLDYEQVKINRNSIIYCDIPYKGTSGYLDDFDYTRFFDWAAKNRSPVFISEFNVDDPRFVEIWSRPRKQKLSSNANNGKRKEFVERLYANKVALEYVANAEMRIEAVG